MKAAFGISDDSSAKGAVRSALDSCLLQLAGAKPVAGLIFWGADYDSAEIAAACAATLGDVSHIGCTTNGEITSQGLGMNSVCLFLFSSDRMSARTSQISLSVGSEEAGRAVAASLRADNAKVLLLLPDGLAMNGTAIIRGAQEILGQGFVIAGGAAGDKERFVQTYQMCDGQLLSGAVPAMMLYTDGALEIGFGVMSGWKPIGIAKTVTSAEGNVVYRIEDETALDLYSRFLADKASQLPAVGYEFPFGIIDESGKIEQPDTHSDDSYILLRSPMSVDHEKGSVTFAAEIPEGAKVRITMAKTYDVVEGARVAAEQALGRLSGRPDAVLFFSCSARMRVLGSRTNREIKAAQAVFGADVPMAGFYAYGEIANCGTADPKCRFHNETATFLALREPSASGDSLSTSNANILDPGIDETQVRIEVLEEALAGAERQTDVLEKFCFGLEQEHKKAKDGLQSANARMKKDLDAAARIQQSLLPASLPESDLIRMAWQYHPCDELAGDSLNVHRLGPGHISLYIVDVSGHGVPAALMSVSVNRSLEPSADPSCLVTGPDNTVASPAEVAQRLNTLYSMQDWDNYYFTMVYGVLDLEAGRFRFITAGHPGPILVRPGEPPKQIEARSLAIGFFEGAAFSDSEVQLAAGDRLYLFSDGLYEEFNAADEQFEVSRLMEALYTRVDEPLDASLEFVRQDLVAWHGGDDFSDDFSILAIEMLGT